MFPLCVKSTKKSIKILNTRSVKLTGLPIKKRVTVKTANEVEAPIELRETYPVRINIKMNVAVANGITRGKIEINIPAPVAMPFPPLNPAKIVKLCPRTAENPANI